MNPFKFLLGSATMPANLRSSLEAEGITFLAEGLTGSITYRNYRAPGKRYGVAKQGTAGAIGISGQRLQASADQPDRVSFRYDAGRFRPDTSGQVEIRLKTPQAAQIMNLINTA